MAIGQRNDVRFWLLLAAVVLTLIAILVPRVPMTRNVYDVVAVLDITASMNVRDMALAGRPVTRLDAAKASLANLLARLPCRSRLGLGIFTERRSFLLFNPVDVCENFAALETAIAEIDWRMGWEGDSMVAKGLHHAVSIAGDVKAGLIFMTDGQEAPPLPYGATLDHEGQLPEIGGLVVGVGGRDKVPLLKFDEEGNEAGTYGPDEVTQENRTGAPPPDAAQRPGYHPKWAPFGNEPPAGDEHLSSVRSEYLATLAAKTNLGHVDLIDNPDLLASLAPHAHARPVEVAVDIRPVPASLALLCLISIYGLPSFAALRRRLKLHSNSRPELRTTQGAVPVGAN
jgi:mxaL protein